MLYGFLRLLAGLVFHTAFRTQVRGRERIPRTGGLLIVSNHLSFADPPLVGWVVPRRIEFMTMAELFRRPLLGAIARQVGAFPVDRNREDHGAAREAVRRLRQGRCVAIFPEGGIRAGEQSLLAIKGGAALIAQLAGTAILPVIVRDTREFHDWRRWFRGGQMTVTIGYPFSLLTRDRAEARDVLHAQLLKTVELA